MPRPIQNVDPIMDAIIAGLREGLSPTWAARKAGISRVEAYRWRAEDEEFCQKWDNAVAEGIDLLEDEARRRAVNGFNERAVYHNGVEVGKIREYSDGLLTLLLKVRRPETFNRPVLAEARIISEAVSLTDARARLLQLGLPIPVIDGDYEYEASDAPGGAKTYP